MLLKSTFLASKKVVQGVQIGGWGGGNWDKIQKDSNFFRETVPNKAHLHYIYISKENSVNPFNSTVQNYSPISKTYKNERN